jgi:23S rRNA pseudouridine2605 synthase
VPKRIEKKSAAADDIQPAKSGLIIEPVSGPEPKAKRASANKADVAPEPPAKPRKAQVAAAPEPVAVTTKATPKPTAPPAKKKKTPAKATAPKAKTAKVKIKNKTGAAAKVSVPVSAPVADPIGDVSGGEAHAADLPSTPGEAEALAAALSDEIESNEEPEYIPAARPATDAVPPAKLEAKLERLQKILAKAGIASRRRAEEMIVEGRVIVNGQVVTQLGAKADLGRDHIRVDGKLLAGAERQRYFVLNKPRGYVTTVSDPEHRPTVMQFFEKMQQRLYPVGRLDYLSEGLLLVTNDGDLANQLTRASLGVEKTYLVKVAGKPTEEELDRLRSGVSIEREGPGSKRVATAPASVRQVRQGDNPWYEVVLIEGRNRELRKMFEQIGHFVEKIRRVAYGPLVLDVEPGEFRELTADEVKSLQLTAEGKLKPKRQRALPTVPKEAPRAAGDRPARSGAGKTFGSRPPAGGAKPAFKPAFKPRFDNRSTERFGGRAQFPGSTGGPRGESRSFDSQRGAARPFRGREESDSVRPQRFEERNTALRPQQRSPESEGDNAPRREFRPSSDRPAFNRGSKPAFNRGGKPDFKRNDRPPFRSGGKPDFNRGDKPVFKRSAPGAPLREASSGFRSERPSFDRGGKPTFNPGARPEFKPGERPAFKRSSPGGPLREGQSRFEGERPAFDRGAKPSFKRDDRATFKPRGEAGGSFESRPSRPPGKTFASRPAGRPAGRSSGAKFSGGSSSGRKFGSGAPRKSGSRPGGKVKPRWDRNR